MDIAEGISSMTNKQTEQETKRPRTYYGSSPLGEPMYYAHEADVLFSAMERSLADSADLLEALKRVMEETDSLPEDCFEDSTFGKAYAAIAKAERGV